MIFIVAIAVLVGLGVGLLLGVVYGLGLTLRMLRRVRDSLPMLEPTDGNVAAQVLGEWMDTRVQRGFSVEDVDAVRRVIDAAVSARPALGEAITRLEGGGR